MCATAEDSVIEAESARNENWNSDTPSHVSVATANSNAFLPVVGQFTHCTIVQLANLDLCHHKDPPTTGSSFNQCTVHHLRKVSVSD